jgi:DNA replication and repair protein RecF
LRYVKGWDNNLEFLTALEQAAEGDRQQGYTRNGPQRADLKVQISGKQAAEILSRGQQKLVACALKLAQGQLLTARAPTGSFLYLVDDLPSELDREHSYYVCDMLSSIDAQVFITCVEGAEVIDIWPDNENLAMFHVEHGNVRQQ